MPSDLVQIRTFSSVQPAGFTPIAGIKLTHLWSLRLAGFTGGRVATA
jgi:hypothetical protein